VVGGGHARLGYVLAVGATIIGAVLAAASRGRWTAPSGTPVRSVESLAE
jgi:hypothetical protein